MADVRIGEVHTEIEITDSVGTLEPAEIKKLIARLMEQIKAQQDREQLRRQDDVIHDRASVPGLGD